MGGSFPVLPTPPKGKARPDTGLTLFPGGEMILADQIREHAFNGYIRPARRENSVVPRFVTIVSGDIVREMKLVNRNSRCVCRPGCWQIRRELWRND